MLDAGEYTKILLSLMVLADPLGAIPLYISLTRHYSAPQRRTTARTACFAFTLALVASIFTGKWILLIFGVSIASFKVGGGILILIMAIAMMEASRVLSKHTPEEDLEAAHRESVAVVPLAIPLMAGPGTISSVIIYAGRSPHPGHLLIISACCVLVGVISYIILLTAGPISRVLGTTGINVAVRLMGLFLAAIAVEFIAGGLLTLFPGLAG